jgi:Uma2 family endonuclease
MRRFAAITAEELEQINLPSKRTELVRGQLLVREPAGPWHGMIAARLLGAIISYTQANDLGEVFAAETGFTLFRQPDTVRAPAVAFIRRERVPGPMTRGYWPIAPDLAVEVLSHDDRQGEVREKVVDWLRAGSSLVWIVDPVRRVAHVHRANETTTFIDEDSALSGENVLPGFVLPLKDVL